MAFTALHWHSFKAQLQEHEPMKNNCWPCRCRRKDHLQRVVPTHLQRVVRLRFWAVLLRSGNCSQLRFYLGHLFPSSPSSHHHKGHTSRSPAHVWLTWIGLVTLIWIHLSSCCTHPGTGTSPEGGEQMLQRPSFQLALHSTASGIRWLRPWLSVAWDVPPDLPEIRPWLLFVGLDWAGTEYPCKKHCTGWGCHLLLRPFCSSSNIYSNIINYIR